MEELNKSFDDLALEVKKFQQEKNGIIVGGFVFLEKIEVSGLYDSKNKRNCFMCKCKIKV